MEAFKPLSPEQTAALIAYIAEFKLKGAKPAKSWKEALSTDWYFARRPGHLHALRNSHGPTWLMKFNEAELEKK